VEGVEGSNPVPSPPAAAQAERRRRFEAAYAAHHGQVLGYVLRRTASPDDAADVLAETFLTAWRRLEDMPGEPRARLWLYGVARRVLANHYRGERRRSALADRLRADLVAAYQPPEYTGELAGIAAAFRALPGPERELLALSSWEGLDAGQIAIVLGCSRNAARIRLHRARRRLAAGLAGGPGTATAPATATATRSSVTATAPRSSVPAPAPQESVPAAAATPQPSVPVPDGDLA
jgi:RNA polymerase sigma-70 factor (ECF subfamily)